MIAFELVRAIVDARIAAREERRRARRRAVSCEETALRLGSPVCRGEAALQAKFGLRAARLPENLKVPPTQSRPPNLHVANLSFAARLLIAVRDKFGGDAPMVYGAARVSRQAYSQIVSDEVRPVSKRTAIRFAFALKSTPEEARLLLKSAGYAFSNSRTEDYILQACLEVDPPIWDLDSVNQLLREYRVDYQY